MADVVVVLRSQAAIPDLSRLGRAQRLGRIEGLLRSHASTAQHGLLQLIAARQSAGTVASAIPLWISNEIAVRATPGVVRELARRPDVLEVRPETTFQAPAPASGAATAAASNLTIVGAPDLWARGLKGQGAVVATLDTGVDVTHPDLAERWRGGTNSWYDPNGQHPSGPVDLSGHGTQVMGVIVGGDSSGTAIGMAPGAKWIAAKIFNDRGQATTTGIHLAFQWALDPDGNPATADAPNVVNSSWTMSTSACATDFQNDLRTLRAAGILPVFAAGNSGPTAGTVLAPANNVEAFAVGATDTSDAVYPYSSRGPSSCAGAAAPALSAPGVDVTTSDLFGGYITQSGTSLAAPHVSGALALLLGALPGLSADRQAAALTATARDLGNTGPDPVFGSGRLDVAAAYAWLSSQPDLTVTVTPSSATAAPGGEAAYDVSLTPANGFAADTTLAVGGLTGSQASASFAPAVVPGGSGTSHLTITLSPTIAPGTYPLTVTATGGGLTRTASASLVVPTPPDFSLGTSPSSVTVTAGGAVTATATVSALSGFGGTVALAASGLPAAVGTVTVSPTSVVAAGSAQVAVHTASSATPGTYTVTVTGTSGATSHSAAVKVVVVAPADFGLGVSPSAVSVPRGSTATLTVSSSAVGGFTGPVSLTLSGLPSGTTTTFSVNPIATPGTSTLRVRPGPGTPRGTYAVTVTGRSGSLSHAVTFSLTVR
jgi:subtilisin family serine protease